MVGADGCERLLSSGDCGRVFGPVFSASAFRRGGARGAQCQTIGRGSDLTPWSSTYYSTRCADLVRSPQAEYKDPPERAWLPSKMIGCARSLKYQVLARPTDARPLPFAGAIYLSLGRRHRSARLSHSERGGGR